MGLLDRGLEIKTPEQIGLMRRAGLLVGQTLELLSDAAKPGVTTGELDRLAEEHIRAGGGVPSFLGYGYPPFPATICASVNEEVVHGIPGSRDLSRATSSRSTAAPSSRGGTATPRSPSRWAASTRCATTCAG
jgi:methionyl aminopeptidase